MIEIRTYVDYEGGSPYAKWFNSLNAPAAAKVVTASVRMEQGNMSNTKRVGSGVFECRIDFGPGYRVYFGKDGNTLIILLGGVQKNVSRMIFRRHGQFGKIIKKGKSWRAESGTYT